MENNRIRALTRALFDRRLPHGQFKLAFERAQHLLELADLGMPGSGFMVHGPSGVGKTTLAKTVENYGCTKYGPEAVKLVQLEGSSTIKDVLAAILLGFGDPCSRRGTASELSARLRESIKARQCRLIIIDELQHLIPGASPTPKLIHSILNAFKVLDTTGVSFLLAGTDEIMTLWHADDQIRSRFQGTYQLRPLTYPEDVATWRAIVKEFEKTLMENGVQVNCSGFADRCHAASQGVFRSLVLVIATAATRAIKEGTDTITVTHLSQAAYEQIDPLDGMPQAFDLNLEKLMRFSQDRQNHALAPVPRSLDEIFSQ